MKPVVKSMWICLVFVAAFGLECVKGSPSPEPGPPPPPVPPKDSGECLQPGTTCKSDWECCNEKCENRVQGKGRCN